MIKKVSLKHVLQKRFGTILEASREVGVAPQVVYEWVRKGSVPPGRAVQLEKLTEVPRYMLHDPWVGTEDALPVMDEMELALFMAGEKAFIVGSDEYFVKEFER